MHSMDYKDTLYCRIAHAKVRARYLFQLLLRLIHAHSDKLPLPHIVCKFRCTEIHYRNFELTQLDQSHYVDACSLRYSRTH